MFVRTVRQLAAVALLGMLTSCGGGSGNTDWKFVGGSVLEERHSPLSKINVNNVDDLGLAWKFEDFEMRGRVHRGNQGTPLVVDRTMYFTGPWSVVYAVDAVTGEEKWRYNPEVEGAWARKTCCDVNNKGVAYQDGLIYVGVVDGFLDAIDANTGKRVWRVDTLADRSRSYSVTGAPRIAGKNIVIGNGGADMDARGYITAYNLKTGAQAWRFWTVPGDPKNPDEHPEMAEARKTWGDESRWDLGGGGTVYDGMVYDPELNIIYAGTSNGVPHPSWLRDPSGGDNLYLSSILAINADSGELKWHYQSTPADSWDFGATQNMILTDLEIEGKTRKVIMQAPKNGFFYVHDRATGELLSAEAYTTVNWATHIDMATGRPVLNPDVDYQTSPKVIWPSVSGGHNWQPMAFSPDSGLVYIPVLEAPMKYVGYDGVTYQPGSLNEGKGPPLMPPFEAEDEPLVRGQPKPRYESVLKAWDPIKQEEVWSSKPQAWWSGGILSTAGGLIFQGTIDGALTVYDANSGKVLKTIETGLAILAPPMSYEIDGEQYIAVLGGLGGSESAYYPDGAAAHKYENKEALFVFKLDGSTVSFPPLRLPEDKQPLPLQNVTNAAVLSRGADLFYENCARCHAYRGAPGGYPNLWNMSKAGHENFNAALLEGAYAYGGMAAFKDILSEPDAAAIHAYIIADRNNMEKESKTGEPVSRFNDIKK